MEFQQMSFEQVNEARKLFLSRYHQFWLEHARFSWQWWFLLITVLACWIIWWKLIDKKRVHELLNFGLISGIISLILNMIGMNHNAWAYPIRLYWAIIPPLIPFDLTYLPFIYMLTYQRYGERFMKFIVAFMLVSAILSFVVEPFFQWIGIYKIYHWKYAYSFPLYMLVACFSKGFLVWIQKRAE